MSTKPIDVTDGEPKFERERASALAYGADVALQLYYQWSDRR